MKQVYPIYILSDDIPTDGMFRQKNTGTPLSGWAAQQLMLVQYGRLWYTV